MNNLNGSPSPVAVTHADIGSGGALTLDLVRSDMSVIGKMLHSTRVGMKDEVQRGEKRGEEKAHPFHFCCRDGREWRT